MTITMSAVYENGILRLDAPLNIEEKAIVRVTIEEPALAATDDPTGWKTADELIGFIKNGPKGPIGRDHDKYLYGRE